METIRYLRNRIGTYTFTLRLITIFLLFSITLCGCSNSSKMLFEDYIRNNNITAYSLREVSHELLLFTANDVFHEENGRLTSFETNIYMENSGQVSMLRTLSGAGTAYPIRVNSDSIWCSDGKTLSKYQIINSQLELVESITWNDDASDSITYTNNKGQSVTGQYYSQFYDEYSKRSEVIVFEYSKSD